MKKILFLLMSMGLYQISYSQIDNILVKDLEVKPKGMEGEQDPRLIIQRNIIYSPIAVEKGICGKVIVSFLVKANGEITDFRIVNSVDPSLDNEALRVVKLTSGHWIPGEKNGQSIDSYYEIPVVFEITKGVKGIDYYYKNADKFYNQSKFKEALEYLEEIRKREPYNFLYLNRLADSYEKTGQTELACKYWNRLVFLNQKVDKAGITKCNK
jgi:TonB family protein